MAYFIFGNLTLIHFPYCYWVIGPWVFDWWVFALLQVLGKFDWWLGNPTKLYESSAWLKILIMKLIFWNNILDTFSWVLLVDMILSGFFYDMLRTFCVSYSCGACGYELNLSSSNRNTATIGSKYGKSIKRGIISFFQIDESRFMKVDDVRCIPYFISKNSWGLFRRRTKLLCRKCGNHVGEAYNDKNCSYPLVPDDTNSSEAVTHRKFDIRIRALQPSSADQTGTPLVHWCRKSEFLLCTLYHLAVFIVNAKWSSNGFSSSIAHNQEHLCVWWRKRR